MTQPDTTLALHDALSRIHADIVAGMRRHRLDPLRYLVDIDDGLARFAPRATHHLRIAYNRRAELSVERSVPHEWLVEPEGQDRDCLLGIIEELVSGLKAKVQASGRPL